MKPTMTVEQLRNSMILNAKAYNRYLTDEFIDNLSTRKLIAFTHPTDRMDFIDQLNRIDVQRAKESLENERV